MSAVIQYADLAPEDIPPEEVVNGSGLIRIGRNGRAYLYPHPGQFRVLTSDKRYVFVFAGTQGGKTSLGPVWLEAEIEKRREGDYLAVTSTYQLFDNKLLPELTRFFCDIRGIGRYHPGKNVIEIADPDTGRFWAKTSNDPMYARILLRSATTGKGQVSVGRLEAATAKAVLLDECGMDAFTLQAWESIKRRTHYYKARILGITTLYNWDWMYHQIYVPWQHGDPNIDVIQFDSIENPSFPVEEYEEARRTLPPWRFNMQYRGIFDRPAGSIYEDFDPAIHVVNPFSIPTHWYITTGIDPGAVNTGVIYLAKNPDDGMIYLFKESIEGNLTSKEHARRVKETTGVFTRVRYLGGAASEKQFRMDWQAAGCPVEQPGVSDVWSGIDRVIQLIRSGKFFVFRSCPRTIAQLLEYSRTVDTAGNQTEKIKDKEKYHLLDALRYAATGIVTGSVVGRQNNRQSRREIPRMERLGTAKIPRL